MKLINILAELLKTLARLDRIDGADSDRAETNN